MFVKSYKVSLRLRWLRYASGIADHLEAGHVFRILSEHVEVRRTTTCTR
jgi:hypothetical protein